METVCRIAFIKEKFFIDNKHFVEMLDTYDIDKQTRRNYIFLNVIYKENNIFVPLRSEIPSNKFYGTIGYPLATKEKPNAGLDFRKILIVNDMSYIELPQHCKIPKAQQIAINRDYEIIENMVIKHIEKYIKLALKQRERVDKLTKYSTLHNFHQELGIAKLKAEKRKVLQLKSEFKEEAAQVLAESAAAMEE